MAQTSLFILLTQYAPLGCMFCFPSVDNVMIVGMHIFTRE